MTQRRIGLTGGIATGKSTVGTLLAARGLPVLDADQFAREALAPGSTGAREVLAHFGERVRAAGEGEPHRPAIDRGALGRIVFADTAERRWLERLVHPLVRARFADELELLQQEPVVVLMIPLLFEAGLDGLCSEVWLVDCGEEQQLQRLMGREGLEEAEARRRISAQWSLVHKRALADVVIDNRGDPQTLGERIGALLSKRVDRRPVSPGRPDAEEALADGTTS
jgi:dephospho-CoA kinase